ncbi:MAG: hypothetical protein SPJ13_07120 [Bacteroidales bacterium]|nr:hypothetical protein [Bacteroidales bacterium]
MKKIVHFFLICAAVGALSSCSSEYDMAKSYLNKFEKRKAAATEQIYVCLPKEVLHTNTSLNDVPDFATLGTRGQDSVIASLTNILDKLNDSVFLSQFNESLLYALSRSNIPVAVVSDEGKLPRADSLHFTLNVVQLEAEEFLQRSRSDFSTRGGTYYAYDYDLRHFSTNAWLKLNARDTAQPIVFKNYELSDRFNGTVTSIKKQKSTLTAHFDRIDLNDAYSTARILGETCARLFIESILIDYVRAVKGTNEYYFYYSPAYNDILDYTSYENGKREGFLPIDEERK